MDAKLNPLAPEAITEFPRPREPLMCLARLYSLNAERVRQHVRQLVNRYGVESGFVPNPVLPLPPSPTRKNGTGS